MLDQRTDFQVIEAMIGGLLGRRPEKVIVYRDLDTIRFTVQDGSHQFILDISRHDVMRADDPYEVLRERLTEALQGSQIIPPEPRPDLIRKFVADLLRGNLRGES